MTARRKQKSTGRGVRHCIYLFGGLLFLGWLTKEDTPPTPQTRISQPKQVPFVGPTAKEVLRVTVPKSDQKPSDAVSPSSAQPPPQDWRPVAATPNLSPKPAITPAQKVIACIDADRLNVRSGPGLSHSTIWTLKRNEAVEVINKIGAWREVSGQRYKGWVHGGYLTPRPAPERKPEKKLPEVKLSVSHAAIIAALIQRSQAYYRGNCPCPYSTTRRGHRGGRRSAYSRPGGASPLCYPSDVSERMIANYRNRQ